MSNIFFIVKCKKYLPESISKQIAPLAVKHGFLWIGGNSIGDYHVNQYRGPSKYIRLIKDKLTTILKKNKKIKYYSFITGNSSFLKSPSEKEFQINQGPYEIQNDEPKYNENIKLTHVRKVLTKLKKTKHGYCLPILLSSLKGDYLVNVPHNIFIHVNKDNLTISSDHKHPLHKTKSWLKRLEKLLFFV